MSRDGWKSKYKDLKATVKGYKNRLAHMTRSRDSGGSEPRERASRSPPCEVEIGELTTDCCGPGWRRWGGGQQKQDSSPNSTAGRPIPGEGFRGSILISLARSWGRDSGVSRSGPDSVRAAPESSRRRAAGRYAHARGGLSLLVSDGAGQQTAPVGGHLQQRSDLHQGVITPFQVSRRAAPALTAWCLDRFGAHRAELQVPRRGQEVVFIHDEQGEAGLPQVPSPALPEVDRPRVPPMARRRLSADCGTTIR